MRRSMSLSPSAFAGLRTRLEAGASVVHLFHSMGPRAFADVLVRRAWSSTSSMGLACDLVALPPVRTPKVPVAMKAEDAAGFRGFDDELARVSGSDYLAVRHRSQMCEAGVPGLYVAWDPDGNPMYAQWLIDSAHQATLHSLSHGLFPNFPTDHTLVEGAYTFLAFRKLGIMAEGMRQLLLKAGAEHGAVRCLTYVADDNVPSLRGCANVGFELDHVRDTRLRLGHRRTTHRPPDGVARSQWKLATQRRPPSKPSDTS